MVEFKLPKKFFFFSVNNIHTTYFSQEYPLISLNWSVKQQTIGKMRVILWTIAAIVASVANGEFLLWPNDPDFAYRNRQFIIRLVRPGTDADF